jgi:murein L,D-transpeptidase YcbB/YkuD
VVRLLVFVGISAITLAACDSGGGEADLQAAEARVSSKQNALEEAKSEAAAAAAQFCEDSAGYITAVDRYGDVLTDTAPTVGDVKDAGRDLAQPREDAMSSAEAAVAAQQEVVAAKNELKDAKAALKAVKNTSTATSSTPKSSDTATTAAPLVPSATVKRVEQAEADFATAQSGIDDRTPLVQASQQFNAAAVALEMAWLRLFVDAGCLTSDQQKQAESTVRDYTASLQESLAEAGYYQGKTDGVYGPTTVDAVEELQEAHGLPVTGTVDKATDAALQADLAAEGGAVAREALTSTAALQQTLKLAGFWDGPVDGEWTPELTEALVSFQTELGVEPTGTVDAATIAAFEKAIAKLTSPQPRSSASPTASAPATPVPSDGTSTPAS